MTDKKDRIFRLELVENDPRSRTQLYLEDIHIVLSQGLGITPDDIDGLQQNGATPKSYEICLKSMDIWQQKGIDNRMNASYQLKNGKSVLITKSYDDCTSVVVKYIPLSWNKNRIFMIFSWYGEVKKIDEEYWRVHTNITNSKEYKGIHNGNYRISIKLKKSIPSSLTIDGKKLEIHYRSQELSCWICGRAHRKHECETAWGNYVNRFSMNQFESEFTRQQNAQDNNNMETEINREGNNIENNTENTQSENVLNMTEGEDIQRENSDVENAHGENKDSTHENGMSNAVENNENADNKEPETTHKEREDDPENTHNESKAETENTGALSQEPEFTHESYFDCETEITKDKNVTCFEVLEQEVEKAFVITENLTNIIEEPLDERVQYEVVADFHHRESSQLITSSEETQTASENPDETIKLNRKKKVIIANVQDYNEIQVVNESVETQDDLLTPGQRSNDNMEIQGTGSRDVSINKVWSQSEEKRGKTRERELSTDEELERNMVKKILTSSDVKKQKKDEG